VNVFLLHFALFLSNTNAVVLN